MDRMLAGRNNVGDRYVSHVARDQPRMDKIDHRILEMLQHDGSLGAAEIADRIGLSKDICWRRIQRLQVRGVIVRTVTLLDAKAVNVGTTVFVTVKTASHSAAWYDRFVKTVRQIPEITEIYRMSGDVDYLLRVVVPDIDTYDAVYKRLIAACEFLDVSASFALETIKYTTQLPLDYVRFTEPLHSADTDADDAK